MNIQDRGGSPVKGSQVSFVQLRASSTPLDLTTDALINILVNALICSNIITLSIFCSDIIILIPKVHVHEGMIWLQELQGSDAPPV